ncbi:hypothetical protein AB0I60_03595 [Actinosynnema sp. NPDC050436]|uniref:hypothetical protein n=1 Tax=Actinosynnema sp. NPDC050436 TaxID=3155659 RepID=UPI0034036CF9
MSDLRTLHDAFAELERRADAGAARTAPVARPRRTARLVPVGATAFAVAGLVAGAVWLVPGGSGPEAAGPPTGSSTALPTTTARSPVPASPDELAARFTVVLGGSATFEATQKIAVPESSPSSKNNVPHQGTGSVVTPQGPDPDAPTSPLISGTLTSSGVTGSFGLAVRHSTSEPGEWCGRFRPDCAVSTLPDGSRLATGTARFAPGATSYMACLQRPDGTTVLLYVGNQEDPGGAAIGSPGGAFHAPQPPLTLDRVKAVVTSDKWW